MASRQAIKKDTEAEQTLSFKREFTEMAFERGIPKYKIAAVLQFIYYAMQLPEELENDYEQYLNEILKPNDMTTLQAKWNETWSGPKFEEVFGDILNEKMSALKEKYDKKIDIFRKQNQEAKRVGREAKRKEEEAKRKEEEAKRKEEEAKRKEEEAKHKEEEAKRNEETIIVKSVIKFNEKSFSTEEISESLDISIEKVKSILMKNKILTH